MSQPPDTFAIAIPDPWNGDAIVRALADVADVLREATGLRAEPSPDGRSFVARVATVSAGPGAAIRRVRAAMIGSRPGESALRLEIDLQIPTEPRIALGDFPGLTLDLHGGPWRASPAKIEPAAGMTSLAVLTDITPKPLGPQRRERLLREIRSIVEWTRKLNDLLPEVTGDAQSERLYADIEHLSLVPRLPDRDPPQPDLAAWTTETRAFLTGGLSVALVAASSVEADYALAVLATGCASSGRTMGRVVPAVPARVIPEMARRAPGILAIPASRLSAGNNHYEMNDDVRVMLDALQDSGTAAIFYGTRSQLQHVFHGGQGAARDPLRPVVCQVPAAPLDALVRFAVRQAAAAVDGGLPRAKEASAIEIVSEVLTGSILATDEARDLVAAAARAVVAGACPDAASLRAFVDKARAATEVLGGIGSSSHGRIDRPQRVQARFAERLSGPALRAYLGNRLLGQDRALDDLAARLATEALTRPAHQPLRYLAQGTPATGKSEATHLLAEVLEVPHIVIDCASFSDVHTASAQLLGSGRGIVGSHRAGRLEEAARGERGAVVEVADLDHAPPQVRGHVGDLFLKALDVGSAESASGATFSCAGLVIAFTVNLPGGLDERLRRGGLGFGEGPSREVIARDVRRELKTLLSGALLSRLGEPILFDPLARGDLQRIAQRAVKDAFERALRVAGVTSARISIDDRVGAHVTDALPPDAWTTGARTIVDLARAMAAHAVRVVLTAEASVWAAAPRVVVTPASPGTLAATIQEAA